MKVIGKGEYGEIISRYFQGSFPKAVKVSKEDLLEILTELLVGTKETRYGPKPKIENLFTIRKTIKIAIDQGAAIPILVPWGGRKMDPKLSLDVAEVSGLRQLIHLDTAIKQFYKSGLHIHLRIEDLNAKWLYKSDAGVDNYSDGMMRLIDLIKADTHIEGIKESSMMKEEDYLKVSEGYGYLLEDVITALEVMPSLDVNTIPAYKELVEKGWVGTLPENQRSYYLNRYLQLYPLASLKHRINMLADYFAGSKARYDLNGRGEPDSSVGSFIQINFSHPVPGAPESIFGNTLYYRTIPESHGRTHIAPWRGKGFIEIIDDYPIAKIISGSNIPKELYQNEIALLDGDNDDNPLIIRADYRLSTFAIAALYPVGLAM